MFRMLDIGAEGTRLSLGNGCLQWQRRDDEDAGRISLEELDAVILATPASSLTGWVLMELASRGIPLVCCNASYQPQGCLEPFQNAGTGHLELQRRQFALPEPLRKRLWQRLIREKIRSQASVLRAFRQSAVLDALPATVRSGDAGHAESRAAALYWRTLDLFPCRDAGAKDANVVFNYAYTVLYGITARHLAAAGFHLRQGLCHRNKYNPFCLASDVMEPYRGWVDAVVLRLLEALPEADRLTSPVRRRLLEGILALKVPMPQGERVLTEALRLTVASLRNAMLQGDSKLLELPKEEKFALCG